LYLVQVQRHAIVVAGFQTSCDAGTRAQVVDQPEACDYDENDDGSGGEVLLQAALLLLLLETREGIQN
jgi:hypothetical protein